MKFLPKNTLAYFNAAPQGHLHDLSALPANVFATSTLAYKASCGQSSPNEDAVTFYTLNHCASIVRKSFTPHEPLPEWAQSIMRTYTDVTMAQGERLLHYLLCITTREMRHLKGCSSAFWTTVKATFGEKSVSVLKSISSNGDEMAAMNKYLQTPPDMSIGQYVKTLSLAFHKAGSAGWAGSYGGKPWGDTTDALVSMLTGATSMEMLVDTGYTLAHNGGPIFDKGMMYSHYDGHLLTVLDVQRSGQMLELMLASQTLGVKKTNAAVEATELIKQHLPQEVKGFVDWAHVDALRPNKDAQPNKYKQLVAAMEHKLTKAASTKDKTKLKSMAAATAAAKAVAIAKAAATPPPTHLMIQGKKVKVTGSWQVYPHQSVTIFERGQ